jgi:hypothetical protein
MSNNVSHTLNSQGIISFWNCTLLFLVFFLLVNVLHLLYYCCIGLLCYYKSVAI